MQATRTGCISAVGAATVVLGLSAVQVSPEQKELSEVEHLGFRFERGGCELGPIDCALRQPQDWRAEEMEIVKESLEAIGIQPLGRRIVERCQQRGFSTLKRYRFPSRRKPSDVRNSRSIPDAELYRDPFVTTINIPDAFFRSRGIRDQFSGNPGYLLTSQILLHECFHAVDDVSDRADFLNLVGFVGTGSSWRFAARTPSEVSALTRYDDELERLLPSGDRGAMWRITRSFALQMRPVRVPSMAAVRSPAEAFAEIGSHLILDPRARKYLPPKIGAYFDKHVFVHRDSK